MGIVKEKEVLELEKSLEKLCQEHGKQNHELELKQSQERIIIYNRFMERMGKIEDKLRIAKSKK